METTDGLAHLHDLQPGPVVQIAYLGPSCWPPGLLEGLVGRVILNSAGINRLEVQGSIPINLSKMLEEHPALEESIKRYPDKFILSVNAYVKRLPDPDGNY